ncbi:hypothetical protein ACT17_32290 [Mycolicibacterium conceptionense]|uniref:Uncharacterized protein n=1 Tax=Mycolicibacterium conceptionense TaxID=451644 RepID=A0A0J8WM00_9MYCO|nr:hypothetical protein ACT17_32290 [Mycolicibacterium conceptionense]
MHDHRVGTVVELLADAIHTLSRRPGGRRFQPLVGNEGRDVFDLLGGGLVVDPTRDRRDDGIFPEALQHCRIPVVGAHHQVAVTLQIGGEPGHGLLEPQLLR